MVSFNAEFAPVQLLVGLHVALSTHLFPISLFDLVEHVL
jgi:hypothetical protein